MNTQKLLVKLTALACLGSISGAAMADAQEEVDKQISNMISGAISARVASSVGGKSGGASLDNGGYGGITNVDVKVGGVKNSSNAYLVGADHNFSKNLIAGAAIDYYTFSGGSMTGINPYVSYLFNDNLFVIGKVGYATGDFKTAGITTSMDNSSASIGLNGLMRADALTAKAGLEVGGSRSKSTTNAVSTTTGTTTYAATGELGYGFAPGWLGFTGLTLNSTNKNNSYSAGLHIGIERELSKDAAVAFKYGTQIDDNQPAGTSVKVNVYTISARFRF